MGKSISETVRSAAEIQLLIKPVSSRCNLNCGYCFYHGNRDLAPGGGVMDQATLRILVGSFLGLGQSLSVFHWQGGEPTLAGLDFFREAVRLQAALGSAGQAVGNSLQTNGILLNRRWATFLAEYRFLVGLSIDGPVAVHDRFRRTAAGERTHGKTLRAAHLLWEHGIAFSVLITVHRGSRAEEIYSWLRQQGFDSLQFIPVVETNQAGLPKYFSVLPEEWGHFLCRLFDLWWPERDKVSLHNFETLAATCGGQYTSCLWAGRCDAYLVVEADGTVYPCDFFVRPDMRLGAIGNTPLREIIVGPQRRNFAEVKYHLPDSCQACDWRRICAGGCLKDRERTGSVDKKTYLCDGLRIFFPHAATRIHFDR